METGFVLAYVLWVSRVRCHPHAFHGRGMLPRSLTYPLLVFQLVWCVNLLLQGEWPGPPWRWTPGAHNPPLPFALPMQVKQGGLQPDEGGL